MPDIQGKCCFEGVTLAKIVENSGQKRDTKEKTISFLKEQKMGYLPMHLFQFRNF